MKGPHALGELPRDAYRERERFPVRTDLPQNSAPGEGPGATPEDRRVIQTVRRGHFVNYPLTIVAATQAQVKALSENYRRCYLFIQVKAGSSVGTLYINYGAPAENYQVEIISPSGTYEFPVVPVDSIWLTASTGTMTVVVTEGTEVW